MHRHGKVVRFTQLLASTANNAPSSPRAIASMCTRARRHRCRSVFAFLHQCTAPCPQMYHCLPGCQKCLLQPWALLQVPGRHLRQGQKKRQDWTVSSAWHQHWCPQRHFQRHFQRRYQHHLRRHLHLQWRLQPRARVESLRLALPPWLPWPQPLGW